jgi:hypothetical protein
MTTELPPSVAFMLDEFRGDSISLANVRKKLGDRGFVRDFDDQCLAGIQTFIFADGLEERLDKFVLYAAGGVDPLSAHGKCVAPACRIAYATGRAYRSPCA